MFSQQDVKGVQKCPYNKEAMSALEFSVQGVPAECLSLPLLFAFFKGVQKCFYNGEVLSAPEFSVQGVPAGCPSFSLLPNLSKGASKCSTMGGHYQH